PPSSLVVVAQAMGIIGFVVILAEVNWRRRLVLRPAVEGLAGRKLYTAGINQVPVVVPAHGHKPQRAVGLNLDGTGAQSGAGRPARRVGPGAGFGEGKRGDLTACHPLQEGITGLEPATQFVLKQLALPQRLLPRSKNSLQV